MHDVSLARLYVLRATYLLIVVGLGLNVWPAVLEQLPVASILHGVGRCLLAAITIVAVLGIRHPLKMLPLLFFELTWKTLWLALFALPAWRAGTIDDALMENIKACGLGLVIFPLVIPWGYAWREFVRAAGDRWR